ncbi:MAG: protein-S-isoprenylcysteine O-methyltransferase Ste14 [Cyclobacteriaceae bacterium]|jgi:protein-S-isoprenylcysteine O-methyltransferase Ste14
MALQQELRQRGNFLFKHRSYLPIVIIVVGLIVFVQSKLGHNQPEWINYYDIGCVMVSAFGLLIRCLAVGYSADHTSGRNTSAGQIADDINATGLYSICRHPLYVGNFFMWLGIAMFTLNFWFIMAFIFVYWLYYERIIYAEEAFLIDKYGSKYLDYSENVPAFIPVFSKWKKSANQFSWIKVIRQEKTGVLNLFLMVFVFKTVGDYLLHQNWPSLNSYWSAGLLIGLAWYAVIKIIQKKTKILTVDRRI